MLVSAENSLYSAASGLRDAQVRLNVTAHNVANLNTDGFQPGRVTSVANSSGGVLPTVEPYAVLGTGPSQSEPVSELLNLQLAKTAFDANSALIRKDRDMHEALMDTFA